MRPYTLGLTLLECAVGKYPYDHLDGGPLGLMVQITQDDPPIPPESNFPESLVDFVLQCMCKSPHDRPAVSALRSHALVLENAKVDAGAFMRAKVVDPMKALQAVADSFTAHYYRLVDHPAPDQEVLVRRCSLTPGFLQLTPRLLSTLESKI